VHHDWMIEVLEDLRAYSHENRLHRLAEELAALRLVALTEIASVDVTARTADCPAHATPGEQRDRDCAHHRPQRTIPPLTSPPGRDF